MHLATAYEASSMTSIVCPLALLGSAVTIPTRAGVNRAFILVVRQGEGIDKDNLGSLQEEVSFAGSNLGFGTVSKSLATRIGHRVVS